jgi:hypothetical protein
LDPLDLLVKMLEELDRRAESVAECIAWYDGAHPTPEPPPNTFPATDREARAAFKNLAALAVTNMLPPIVDTPASKLRVEGFRFSESPQSTDGEAWTIWQRNHLDADSDLGNFTALQTGQEFALVWVDGDGLAQITVEDPAQCIVAYEPGSRRRRAAGVKRWVDDDGHVCATLYLPTEILKYRSAHKADDTAHRINREPRDEWLPREVPGEPWPLPNPLGVVPLVEGRANPAIRAMRYGGGSPEFTKQITLQRQLNSNVMAMLTTMEHQAFRQRWVIGWAPPTLADGTTPDRRALLRAAASDMWVLNGRLPEETANIKVGEFSQADLRPFVDVNREVVKAMAATSATPPYAFLLGDMVNVAADSLARIEGALVAKVRSHARHLGEFWEEVLALALRVEGNPKADDPATSVVWADIEERTATEQAALAKTYAELGAPKPTVFAQLPGIDQQEAQRMATQSRAESLLNRVGQTPPLPADPDD